jgi:hypothetical protein
MSGYLGDYAPGDTVDFNFNTSQFSTGAPFTLADTPSLICYKGSSDVGDTSGITLDVDFDGLTGLHHATIDTSSDGTFYAAGSQIEVVIAAGEVDSISVIGKVIGRFTLRAQASLYPTTAGRTLDVTATGATGIDWGNVENPTTALNLSGTNIDTDQVVASVAGAVGSVTAGVTVTTNNDKTGYALSVAGYQAIMTTQMTQSYATLGTVPTPAQIFFEMRAILAENSVATTTVTTKQINGSSTAATYTLDDATNPTSITRAS